MNFNIFFSFKKCMHFLYAGVQAVTELHAYVNDLFIQGTYDSCKSVMMSSTNQPAMTVSLKSL